MTTIENTTGRAGEIRAELRELVEPLRGKLVEIEDEIAERERELADLREARREIRSTITHLDPASAPPKKQKATQEARAGWVGPETVDDVEKRLREKVADVNGNGGFTTTSLRRDHGFEDISSSTLQKAIRVLHDRGAIRLDHRGRGGAHFYKVVKSRG